MVDKRLDCCLWVLVAIVIDQRRSCMQFTVRSVTISASPTGGGVSIPWLALSFALFTNDKDKVKD